MKNFKIQFKKRKFEAKEIGHIGVDAGMIMIGDPCYSIGMRDDADKQFVDEIYGKNWFEFCDKADAANYELQLPYGFGFCISTCEGEGFYNVYGLFDDESEQPKFLLVQL